MCAVEKTSEKERETEKFIFFYFFVKCNLMFDLSRSVRIDSTLFARFNLSLLLPLSLSLPPLICVMHTHINFT